MFAKKLIIFAVTVFSISSQANEFGVGLDYHNFDYVEDIVPPGKSSESGWVPLLAGFLKVPLVASMGKDSYFKISGSAMIEADTHYSGTTLNGNNPVETTDKGTFYDLDSSIYLSPMSALYFHAGVGYHYWKRTLTSGSGYKEVYTWYTIPLGIMYFDKVASNFSMGVDFTYKLMMNGKIQVIFSESISTGDDSTLDLGNLPGYRIEFPMETAISNRVRLRGVPYYEHSEIGESNIKFNNTPVSGGGSLGNIQEPNSKTNQYGLVGFVIMDI
jgi:hypothetical protein